MNSQKVAYTFYKQFQHLLLSKNLQNKYEFE